MIKYPKNDKWENHFPQYCPRCGSLAKFLGLEDGVYPKVSCKNNKCYFSEYILSERDLLE